MLDARNFLVPDATLLIELVAFLVVLVVVTHYVLPRIRAAMQARERAIIEALSAARDAEQQRQTAQSDAEEIRAAARRDARVVRDRAWSSREQLVAEGRRAGAEEYRWLAGRAHRELQRRTDLSRQQAREQARAAAVAALREYVGEDVDAARLAQLVDKHLSVAFDQTARTRIERPRQPAAA